MSWPAPQGPGILPPDAYGVVTYNAPLDEIIKPLHTVIPAVVWDWHDKADPGTDYARALMLGGES